MMKPSKSAFQKNYEFQYSARTVFFLTLKHDVAICVIEMNESLSTSPPNSRVIQMIHDSYLHVNQIHLLLIQNRIHVVNFNESGAAKRKVHKTLVTDSNNPNYTTKVNHKTESQCETIDWISVCSSRINQSTYVNSQCLCKQSYKNNDQIHKFIIM